MVRECRDLGARRGIGSIRGIGGFLGAVRGHCGHQGVLGAGREWRYSGARRV